MDPVRVSARVAIVLALALSAGACSTALPIPTPAPAISSAAAAASTPPSSTPSIRPSSPAPPTTPIAGAVVATPTQVPFEFRYFTTAETASPGILLADLRAGTVTPVVAGGITFSASADGRRLLVGARSASGHSALYLVDVEVGAARLVVEDPILTAPLFAVLSPDARRIAYADLEGVKLIDAASGALLRVVPHVDPQMVGGTWRPIAWSTDAAWLALERSSEGSSEVAIVDTGTALRTLGEGVMVSWRAKAPELLVMNSRNAFGGRSGSYTYDLGTRRTTRLEPDGTELRGSLAWHPTQDRFLYTAGPDPIPVVDVYTRALSDGAPTKIVTPRKVTEAWWSRDGSTIYGLAPRQDALAQTGVGNSEIVDLASGKIVATVCRGDARAACP